MKYNLTYKQALDYLDRGYAVRPQSFMYTYDFLMFYDGSVKRFTMDKFDKRHLFVNGEYDSMRTDDLSKWAVFDAMSIDRDNML